MCLRAGCGGFFAVILRFRDDEARLLGLLLLHGIEHEAHHLLGVGVGLPDELQEVRRVDVSVLAQEVAILGAAVHDVGREGAEEFGGRFADDARQVCDLVEVLGLGREIGGAHGCCLAPVAALSRQEEIAAHGGNEQ